MAAAYAARKEWAGTPPVDRAKILNKAAQILESRRQEIAEVLALEGGGTFGKVMFEITQTVDLIETAAADGKRILGETFHFDPTKLSMTLRRPRGTMLAISPLELSPGAVHVQGGLRPGHGQHGGAQAGQRIAGHRAQDRRAVRDRPGCPPARST